MNHLFATVAVPVPLFQLFTYSIPESLRQAVKRGSIVLVPFGRKNVNGVVTAFESAIPSFKTKQILDVVDTFSSLNDDQVRLAEWIADYYAAPIGETMKLFLPAGFHQTEKRTFSLTDAVPDDREFPSSKKKIVALLRHNKSLSTVQIQKLTGIKSIHSVLHELTADGTLTSRNYFEKSPQPKKEWFFFKNEHAENIRLKSEQQLRCWSIIEQYSAGHENSVKQFLRSNNIPLSTLRSLAAKNIISLFQKEMIREDIFEYDENAKKSLSITLNPHQLSAFQTITAAIDAEIHQTFLLHGITGSGKTQVYIEAIRHALSQEKSSIVLIPEISLTPQTVKRFQIHFGDVVVWIHSKMSVAERYNAWKLAKEGKYKIVIGPRSALFAPLQNIGLIIVDEEHEASYKQFDSVPRYHARDAAIVKALLNNSVVVLGSATPSLESYFNAQSGKYILLTLPERADNANLPPVVIVNMIDERKRNFAEKKVLAKTIGKAAFDNFSKSISALLEQKIRDRLQKQEKTILLQNRRGFAPFLECADCGHIEQCDRCSVTMTYHAPQRHLRCHYCGKIKHPPTDCPKCHGHQFEMRGFGTQRVEEELSLLFPDARILRMDLDTTTGKNAHEKILQHFGKGNADILLGTQMVAKGLDFPEVTLVGVISADTQMMLPDFRSAERTFQLLTQVAGRAGRSTLQGEVIIQTSQPEHYALAHVQDHDYVSFYREEIEYRKALGYPPFSRIILVEIKGESENKVQRAAEQMGKSLMSILRNASILGPAPAALAKIKNDFRWQIIVKVDKDKDRNAAKARGVISSIVQQAQQSSQTSGIKMFIDVDPAGIM